MPDVRTTVDAQIQQLQRAADVQEGSSRAAGVAKDAAILGALVAAESNEVTRAAAVLLSDALTHTATATTNAAAELTAALDRNTAASNKTGMRMIILTAAYVLLTAALLLTAWLKR